MTANTGSGARYWHPFWELSSPLGYMTSFSIIPVVQIPWLIPNCESSSAKFLVAYLFGIWFLCIFCWAGSPFFSDIMEYSKDHGEMKFSVWLQGPGSQARSSDLESAPHGFCRIDLYSFSYTNTDPHIDHNPPFGHFEYLNQIRSRWTQTVYIIITMTVCKVARKLKFWKQPLCYDDGRRVGALIGKCDQTGSCPHKEWHI